MFRGLYIECNLLRVCLRCLGAHIFPGPSPPAAASVKWGVLSQGAVGKGVRE